MDAQYVEAYDELSRHHFWWAARRGILAPWIDDVAGGGHGPVLEVGCGAGWWFSSLERIGPVVGLEPDEGLAELGRSRGHAITTASIEGLALGAPPLRRSHFAAVAMFDVLEHLDDRPAALTRIAEVLRPGGALLLTVPAWRALWTRHDDLNHHRTRYRRRTLRAELKGAGFRVERMEYAFGWLVLPKLATRVAEQLLPRPHDDELPSVPPAVLNGALRRLSELEMRVPGRGRWPVGTSLVALARKR